MEYEEFVRRFNARAKKRAEEFEKASAQARADVDRIVAQAKTERKTSDTSTSVTGRSVPTQQRTPARKHRKVQGILKQM